MFSLKLFAFITLISLAYAVCPGCLQEKDVNSPEVKEHLRMIVGQEELDSGVLLNVVSVTSQVVAGAKYIVEFEKVYPHNKTKDTCKVVYIVQSWVSKTPIVDSLTCEKMQ